MLCDLCSLVVGSVNQPADMTRPLSLITHFFHLGCQHGLGQGGCGWQGALLQCCTQGENCAYLHLGVTMLKVSFLLIQLLKYNIYCSDCNL